MAAESASREFRQAATLKDGTAVVVRGLRPEDRDALRDGFQRLSPETIYHRFFQTKAGLSDAELRYLTELDFENHVALVVTVETGGREDGVAVARFVRATRPGAHDRAEIAFVVRDDYQHRGIGTLLMACLTVIARGLGYAAFEAEVLPDNLPMLQVFEHSGLPMSTQASEGMVHVVLDLRQEPGGGASTTAQ